MALAVAIGWAGWFQAGWTAVGVGLFQPPPTLAGGRKRVSAVMFWGAPRLAGMGWL
ncbi:hypothetical protein [Devosia sp.]|uniref:hypothetical protein n=1 Tax=Devosia sp. TaxID=1871048 RepID=UPI00292E1AE3|nr:hypothetical protein [Devosia sp.]